MKILIDGRWVKQTGIGRYVEQTTEEILKLDHKNDYKFLIRDQERAKYTLKADNVEMISANYRWFTKGEQTGLLKIINDQKPDLVHFPNFSYPIRYRGKFILTIHDLTLMRFKTINSSRNTRLMYEAKHAVMKYVIRTGVKKATYVIVPTQYVKDELVKKYHVSSRKIVVTHEAAEAQYQKPRVDLTKFGITKPFILHVGNTYPHKNIERLILAFGKITTDYMLDYQLVLAGKRDEFTNRIEAEVRKAGVSDKVVFTGYVSDSELAGLYKAATIYSFPSLSEGFGLPGLEAMTYGLPVVSSNATCLPEVYDDAAEYYDPTNVDDMAKVMATLISDTARQEELRTKGLARVQQFSWEKCARETLAVYKRALKK